MPETFAFSSSSDLLHLNLPELSDYSTSAGYCLPDSHTIHIFKQIPH